MRPYYQDDAVTLWHGDCTELNDLLVGERLVTDPPYGAGAYESDRALPFSVLEGWIRHFRTAAFFGYPETLAYWCAVMHVHPSEWVCWWPTNKPMARARLLPRESEHIAIFGEVVGAQDLFRPRSDDEMTRRIAESRGNDVEAARLGDVWREPAPGAGFNRHLRLHVNEKPIETMRRLVLLCSRPGDTIVDPCAGSGTTLRAAKDLGRQAVGIEIVEANCAVAAKRLSQEVIAA